MHSLQQNESTFYIRIVRSTVALCQNKIETGLSIRKDITSYNAHEQAKMVVNVL